MKVKALSVHGEGRPCVYTGRETNKIRPGITCCFRVELRKKYSSDAATKVDLDYTRTKQDFHRMDLDRMDEYHPISRPKMRAAYFAYLQARLCCFRW